jgi:hypothetical protein
VLVIAVVDPEGYVVVQLAGEGHAHGLRVLLPELVEGHTVSWCCPPASPRKWATTSSSR